MQLHNLELYLLAVVVLIFFLWLFRKPIRQLGRQVTVTPLRVSHLHRIRLPDWIPGRRKKYKGTVFVVDFIDYDHTESRALAPIVSTILDLATSGDQVLMRLDSPGGNVTYFEWCAIQIMRLQFKNLPMTVCVEQYAASGGYFLAVMGQKIVATSASEIGSIGVYRRAFNARGLLKKLGIEMETYTAGNFKNFTDPFLELTSDRMQAFEFDTKRMHDRFKAHIRQHRPGLDIEALGTGALWRGDEALNLGLIDEIGTSEDELRKLEADGYRLLHVCSNRSASASVNGTDMLSGLLDEVRDAVWRILRHLDLR